MNDVVADIEASCVRAWAKSRHCWYAFFVYPSSSIKQQCSNVFFLFCGVSFFFLFFQCVSDPTSFFGDDGEDLLVHDILQAVGDFLPNDEHVSLFLELPVYFANDENVSRALFPAETRRAMHVHFLGGEGGSVVQG